MAGAVAVAIIVVVGVVVLSAYFAGARRKELRAWAESRSLSFDPSKDRRMDDRFDEFGCLRRGHSRYAYNVMRGDWAGLPVTLFDYHYATGSGKNRSDHRFSAAVARSPVPLKPLRIRREGFLDKVSEFFGLDDIDFESAEFSRRFHVSSPDRRWAYAVIHQRMMDYLLRAPELSVQFGRECLMAWSSGTLEPRELQAAVELARGILDLLPDYLVRQQMELG